MAPLSLARTEMGVADLGNKVFFAGGAIPFRMGCCDWGDDCTRSSRVDIYDASANTWTTAELSLARGNAVGASAGNKVLFGGGHTCFDVASDAVDIYDAVTNSWSTTALSQQRLYNTATSIGNKIYFAGGYHNLGGDNWENASRIDIYDVSSNTWSISEMNQGRVLHGAIAVGNKNYWAGGRNNGNSIEIREANAQSSTMECLFQSNTFGYYTSGVKNNKIVFFSGRGIEKNKFDIYDISANTWSIGVLNQNIEGAVIISVNNTIYIAGGYVNDVLSSQVWKLEF